MDENAMFLLRKREELTDLAMRAEAAIEDRNTVLQHRLGALATWIADELTTIRANIKAKAQRHSEALAKMGGA
jgi:hypothetical protein